VISTAVRRLLALASFTAVAVAATAGPAAADVPEGWPEAEPVSVTSMLVILLGIPALVFVVIALMVSAPALARGESITPGTQDPDQWLGGPRKSAGELAGPDSEESAAGGAGGSW
jgi:hypothetical protein